MFSCEFCEISKNTFLQNTSGRLLLSLGTFRKKARQSPTFHKAALLSFELSLCRVCFPWEFFESFWDSHFIEHLSKSCIRLVFKLILYIAKTVCYQWKFGYNNKLIFLRFNPYPRNKYIYVHGSLLSTQL